MSVFEPFFCVDYSSVAFVLYESLGDQEGRIVYF